MLKKIITVEGMHCAHCAGTVERVISELEGVNSAKVNLDKKTCTAKVSEDIDDAVIKSTVKDAGFDVTDIQTKKGLF